MVGYLKKKKKKLAQGRQQEITFVFLILGRIILSLESLELWLLLETQMSLRQNTVFACYEEKYKPMILI